MRQDAEDIVRSGRDSSPGPIWTQLASITPPVDASANDKGSTTPQFPYIAR